jgi:hypothetical protein
VLERVQATVDSVAGSATADFRAVFPRLQPRLQEARDNYLGALRSAEKVLTPAQWQQLPEALRNPRLPGPGRGLRGGQGEGQTRGEQGERRRPPG